MKMFLFRLLIFIIFFGAVSGAIYLAESVNYDIAEHPHEALGEASGNYTALYNLFSGPSNEREALATFLAEFDSIKIIQNDDSHTSNFMEDGQDYEISSRGDGNLGVVETEFFLRTSDDGVKYIRSVSEDRELYGYLGQYMKLDDFTAVSFPIFVKEFSFSDLSYVWRYRLDFTRFVLALEESELIEIRENHFVIVRNRGAGDFLSESTSIRLTDMETNEVVCEESFRIDINDVASEGNYIAYCEEIFEDNLGNPSSYDLSLRNGADEINGKFYWNGREAE